MAQNPGSSGGTPSDKQSALVQFEALRSEFQVVLDGQRGITKRIDELAKTRERLEQLERVVFTDVMITGFRQLRKELGGRLDEVQNELGDAKRHLKQLTESFDAHKAHQHED